MEIETTDKSIFDEQWRVDQVDSDVKTCVPYGAYPITRIGRNYKKYDGHTCHQDTQDDQYIQFDVEFRQQFVLPIRQKNTSAYDGEQNENYGQTQ